MSAPGLRASTKSLPRVARPEADLKGARRPTNTLPARIALKIVIILSGPTTTAWSSKMRLSGPPGQITARLSAMAIILTFAGQELDSPDTQAYTKTAET